MWWRKYDWNERTDNVFLCVLRAAPGLLTLGPYIDHNCVLYLLIYHSCTYVIDIEWLKIRKKNDDRMSDKKIISKVHDFLGKLSYIVKETLNPSTNKTKTEFPLLYSWLLSNSMWLRIEINFNSSDSEKTITIDYDTIHYVLIINEKFDHQNMQI